MHTSPAIVVGTCALAVSVALPASAAIIYQARPFLPNAALIIADPDEPSSFTELNPDPSSREQDQRIGDVITFAGSDRFITRFDTRMIAFASSAAGLSLNVELTIYTNVGGLPGTLLWSGITAGVTFPNTIATSSIEASFTPNITVPNSICFGIGFTSINRDPRDSRVVGISTTNLATVGSSPNTTLRQRSDDGVWFVEDLSTAAGGAFRHIDARVEAVPTPSTAAITLALLAPLGRRR